MISFWLWSPVPSLEPFCLPITYMGRDWQASTGALASGLLGSRHCNCSFFFQAQYARLRSRSFSTDPSCKLHVLGRDGDTLGMDGTEVCVLKEANQIRFGCVMYGYHGIHPREMWPDIAWQLIGSEGSCSRNSALSRMQMITSVNVCTRQVWYMGSFRMRRAGRRHM